MKTYNDYLVWCVFHAGVCYARKRWNNKALAKSNEAEWGHYERTWEQLWALQRYLQSPPIGLIRSCE